MRKLVLAAALIALVPTTALAAAGHGGWRGSGFRGAPVAGAWHGGWHGGGNVWYGHRYWGGWGGAVFVGPAYYPAPVYYGWYYAPAPVYYPAYAPVVVEERVYETAPRARDERPAPPVARAPSAQSQVAPQPQPYSSTTTQRGGATLPSKADRN